MGFLDNLKSRAQADTHGVVGFLQEKVRAKAVQLKADAAFEAHVQARARAAADRVYESESIKQAVRVQKARIVHKADERIQGFKVGNGMPSMMGGGLPALPPVFGNQQRAEPHGKKKKHREERPPPAIPSFQMMPSY